MTIHPYIWLEAKMAWHRVRNKEFLLTVSVFGFFFLMMLGSALLLGTLGTLVQMMLHAARMLAAVLARPMLTGVFLLWVLIPFLAGTRYASTGELDRMFAFPIRMGRWYALNVLWALTDPLIFLFAPAFLWLLYGMELLERPGTCVLSLLIVLLFVLTTIAFVQWIGHLLQAILTRRRASKVFPVCAWTVFLLGIAGLVIAALRASDPFALLSRITGLGVLRILPSSLAADALVHLHRGEAVELLFPLSTLLVYLVLVGRFGYRLFLRIHLEGIGPVAKRPALDRSHALEQVDGRLDRVFSFLRPEARVFLAKDLVYLARWNLFKFMYPYTLLGYLALLVYFSHTGGRESLCVWIPFSIVMMVLSGLPPALNVFGIEGAGARHHFIAPVSRKTAFVTKNVITFLANAVFVFSFLLLSFVVFRDIVGDIHWLWLAAFALYVQLACIGIGNVLSVLYPKAIDFKRFWARGVSMQAIFPVLGMLYGLFLFPVLFTTYCRISPYGRLFIYAGLAVLALVGNLLALGPASNLLDRRKERVLRTLEWEDKRIWKRR